MKDATKSSAEAGASDSQAAILKPPSWSKHPPFNWLYLHREKIWWLHSFYALILGIGIMWLGTRNFAYLRVTVFYVGFIWVSSLLLPNLAEYPRLSTAWARRIRLVVNYFNKNFYQQMLFFVLPVYYGSATLWSRNILFVLLVGLSATLSSLDIVYDRHLSVRRSLTAVFFAFNLFALINVMLPVLWSISNTWAMRVSAVLALLGFLTLYYPPSQWRAPGNLALLFLIASMLLILVELGRSFIPPAPLRLAKVQFGREVERESRQIKSPLTKGFAERSLQVYGLTAIKAPLGLKERVRHRWYENDKLVCESPLYSVVGGREEGFRLWTRCTFTGIPPGALLRLDLETKGGQLIGRAWLRAGK